MDYKRKQRKTDHINNSLIFEEKLNRNCFDDITIVHNCLSEVDVNEVDISSSLADIKLKTPIIINAMTGGMPEGEKINSELAKIAKRHDLAMALGSQRIALNNPDSISSFKIVREVNPDGIIFANLGSDVSVEEAQRAVDMIDANAIQIHLNVPQEIAMSEGRRNFKGTLRNIWDIVKYVDVPVIVKEVGFGIAAEEAKILVQKGVKIIDIGGFGGTNFVAIENMRKKDDAFENLQDWGIPTPISLIEVSKTVEDKADIIASGGLKSGLDVAKSIALGSKAAAFAGWFLYLLLKEGPLSLSEHIRQIKQELIYVMVMAGAKNIEQLQKRPVVVSGKTYKWLKYRGFYS